MERLHSKKKVLVQDISEFLCNVMETDFGAMLVDDASKEYESVAKRLVRAFEKERDAPSTATISTTLSDTNTTAALKYIKPPSLPPTTTTQIKKKNIKKKSGGGGGSKMYYDEKHAHLSVKHEVSKRNKHTGRSDRATVDQVMDPRTRLMLFKIVNENKYFSRLYGCISTGKEANVYHAVRDKDGTDLAVKVYKTSILVFKDRNKYVEGEYRYRNGYCRKNPRKMVKMWAEKEMRNLKRLRVAGVRCPEPVLLRNHILVMTFLGKQGWAAPRLKNTILSRKAFRRVYEDLLRQMRLMYQVCGLVRILSNIYIFATHLSKYIFTHSHTYIPRRYMLI